MGSWWSLQELIEDGEPVKREDTPILEKKIWTNDDIVKELKSNNHFNDLRKIVEEDD